MFAGFFEKEYKKVGFEDVQIAIKDTQEYIIINTLPVTEQECLIKSTTAYHLEEQLVNSLLHQYNALTELIFIVYGRNGTDETALSKCKQLSHLGFKNVYIYIGGLFEWLLLQDIYGADEFPTTKKVLDILAFKPKKQLFQKR
uniref:Rhodanese domain-containing protein n=1 Tax=viral metagenome TaxID=1070528 RepID=A0A6C0I441_9ZZZZ